eukprot:TRINITY_DN51_c3_g1_i2.p1 TRINITY_DN51_c3_g1~~TRINITY_DN51_c3_g1_i2.p1  ORF type:complete len:148 (-),score=21.70 TRINITY_DN51_c3_g1_i2:68-511(-)
MNPKSNKRRANGGSNSTNPPAQYMSNSFNDNISSNQNINHMNQQHHRVPAQPQYHPNMRHNPVQQQQQQPPQQQQQQQQHLLHFPSFMNVHSLPSFYDVERNSHHLPPKVNVNHSNDYNKLLVTLPPCSTLNLHTYVPRGLIKTTGA